MCGAEGLWLAVKLLTQHQLFLMQERQGLMGYIAPAPSSEALSEVLQIVAMCTPPDTLAIKQGPPTSSSLKDSTCHYEGSILVCSGLIK